MNYYTKYYLNNIEKYVDFNGRAQRKEFWYFMLFNILTFGALFILTGVAFVGSGGSHEEADSALNTFTVIYLLVALIPSFAVSVRRLHDINKNGWTLLIAIIPFAVLWVYYLMLKDSDHNDNKYGPNPKGKAHSLVRNTEVNTSPSSNKRFCGNCGEATIVLAKHCGACGHSLI